MKTNYKKNPMKILGYLMVFAMVLLTTKVNGQCTASGAVCACPMIYAPVCGCDGVLYDNDCLANCQGVQYSTAVPNGSGGFLPCAATPPPVASSCCNISAYGSAIAPTSGVTSISTCNYLSEYSTISSVAAATDYTLLLSGANANPGWISVYEGSSCGTLVAEGAAPLTFTSTVAGTYYVHWHVDNTCVTATGCHTTSIMYGSPVLGCTDPIATNYNASANVDDGSCTYIVGCMDPLASNYDSTATQACSGCCTYAGCTSGIGANSESFEGAPLYSQGPWANWTLDATTSTFTGTNAWRADNLGTGSSGTGPLNGAPSFDGDYYLYCETSGQYNKVANLNSSCVDLNNFTMLLLYLLII
jgi:hypothetical protein